MQRGVQNDFHSETMKQTDKLRVLALFEHLFSYNERYASLLGKNWSSVHIANSPGNVEHILFIIYNNVTFKCNYRSINVNK